MDLIIKLVEEAKKQTNSKLLPYNQHLLNQLELLSRGTSKEVEDGSAPFYINQITLDLIRRALLIYHNVRIELIENGVQTNESLTPIGSNQADLIQDESTYQREYSQLYQQYLDSVSLSPLVSLLPIKELFIHCRGLIDERILLLSGQELIVIKGGLYHLLLSDADINIKNGILERVD